jgi:hypothetical protein
MKTILSRIFTVFRAGCGRLGRPKGGMTPIPLANELGGMFDNGRETLQPDPSMTLPLSGGIDGTSGHYLGYMRGPAGQYYGKPWDGGSGASSFPLGISVDAPYQAGDFFEVERLGAIKGIFAGISAGAITIDHYVYAAATGLVGDLATAASGTYWVIGKACKTAGAAGLEISFVPMFPFLLTTNGSGTYTYPTNPL